MNKLKQEKGSITLFVLIAMLFFVLFLTGMYMLSTSGEQSSIAETAKIKEIYERDINQIDDVYATIINEQPLTPNVSVGESTHEAHEISYSWEQLHEIAKVISNNYGEGAGKINNNTAEVGVVVEGEPGTLGIGDWKMLNGNKVRILGFNHDTLATSRTNEDGTTTPIAPQYGEGTTNTYAGISFEFVECLGTGWMNGSQTNSGGWEACDLRGTLNSTILDSLENKEYIKEVNKQYIATRNNPDSVKTSQDKIWLLSCSEIWNNGRESKVPYGLAIAKEGEQYKYYKDMNTNAQRDNAMLSKWVNGYKAESWLRSPYYNEGYSYCTIASGGYPSYSNCRLTDIGLATAFSI